MSTTRPTSAEMAARRRPAGADSPWRRLGRYQAINIVVIYAVVLVVAVGWSLVRPDQLSFATAGNLAVLAQQIPVTAIVAIGVGLLMISGEFDISVAGTFTLVPFVVAVLTASHGFPLLLAIAAGIAVAIVVGVINGVLTTRFAIPSFIATLGTMFVLRGAVRWISLNPQTNQPDSDRFFPGDLFEALFTGQIAGPLYAQVVWLLVVAIGGWALLNRHKFGNHLFACGGNRNAAVAVGVPVPQVKMIAFIICAVLAGFAGILQATRINEIEPSYATISGLELKAIAAVVVGGVSLLGGRGAILGMVLGAALIETVDNLLVLVSAPETVFKGFLGAVIIVAAVLNAVIRKRGRS
ncbi:MAG: ABC transporter permease [Geminicoccaceae bacterium]